MSRKPHYNSEQLDKTVWIGKFTGYRVLAFGREQVLNAAIEVHVRQTSCHPAVWVAHALPGGQNRCASAATAAAAMSCAAGLFTTCLEPWRAYTVAELCQPRPRVDTGQTGEERAEV